MRGRHGSMTSPPVTVRYSRSGHARLIFFISRSTESRNRDTNFLLLAFDGSAPNCRKSCRHVRVISVL